METMISMVNALEVSKPKNEKEKNPVQQPCFICSSTRHSTKACPDGRHEDDDDGYEEAHYVNQQINYAQNSNPITRNYEPPQRRMANDSNFTPRPQGQNSYQGSQGSTQNSQYSQGNSQRPYQAKSPMNDQGNSHHQGQASSNPQDKPMMAMMAQMLESQKETNKKMEELVAENKRLAKENSHMKQIGKLPSQPDVNFTEHCNAIFLEDEEPSLMDVNAITLKSGRVLTTPQRKPSDNDKEIEAKVANENSEVELQAPMEEKEKEEEPILMRKYVPVIPFPQRLKKS
ncbi:unnamed protein product [Rhodiola kirilowii]